MILCDDATLTNAEAAAMACASVAQAGDVRRRLIALGVLEPQREPRRAFPVRLPLPPMPWLAEAPCVGHPKHWWTSDDPGERASAKAVCRTACHVRESCLSWSLRAVPVGDSAIYGGTGPAERRRLRAQRGITRPNAVAAINARKTWCPECGEALSGENLITEPGRRPGTVRRRCRACTRRRKAGAYERRREAAS